MGRNGFFCEKGVGAGRESRVPFRLSRGAVARETAFSLGRLIAPMPMHLVLAFPPQVASPVAWTLGREEVGCKRLPRMRPKSRQERRAHA